MVTYSVSLGTESTVVGFELDSGVINPDELEQAVAAAPEVDATKGVILSGRGPVWLYAALVHRYHATTWVATMDPRLGGGVVVETHSPNRKVGEVVAV